MKALIRYRQNSTEAVSFDRLLSEFYTAAVDGAESADTTFLNNNYRDVLRSLVVRLLCSRVGCSQREESPGGHAEPRL